MLGSLPRSGWKVTAVLSPGNPGGRCGLAGGFTLFVIFESGCGPGSTAGKDTGTPSWCGFWASSSTGNDGMDTMDDETKIITILVNGDAVETYIDEYGVQRFIPCGVVDYMFLNDQIDMNQLFKAFMADEFTLEEYQSFYQDLGFSVGGFEEVFGAGSGVADETGEPCVILNPLEGYGQTIQ